LFFVSPARFADVTHAAVNLVAGLVVFITPV